ncbi:MAG: hypothetical protein H6697_06795 [Myxococcales bacterium]|nr:hypothetical protein [Myxococcales bacterium]MCB9521185.1 hypothetical protein [Myxococcales bacterium]
MLLSCTACGHTGPPTFVGQGPDGVILACVACGAQETLAQPQPHAPPTSEPARAVAAPTLAPGYDHASERLSAPARATPVAVAEPRRASSAAPRALPPHKCPKCGHRQHDPENCHKCGLRLASPAAQQRPWERPPPGLERAYAEAEARWAALSAPDAAEVAAHEEFLEWCRSAGVPTFAAMRYRHLLADAPEDTFLQACLERAQRDATVLVQAMARGDGAELAARAKVVRQVVLVITGILAVIMTIILLRMVGRAPSV